MEIDKIRSDINILYLQEVFFRVGILFTSAYLLRYGPYKKLYDSHKVATPNTSSGIGTSELDLWNEPWNQASNQPLTEGLFFKIVFFTLVGVIEAHLSYLNEHLRQAEQECRQMRHKREQYRDSLLMSIGRGGSSKESLISSPTLKKKAIILSIIIIIGIIITISNGTPLQSSIDELTPYSADPPVRNVIQSPYFSDFLGETQENQNASEKIIDLIPIEGTEEVTEKPVLTKVKKVFKARKAKMVRFFDLPDLPSDELLEAFIF